MLYSRSVRAIILVLIVLMLLSSCNNALKTNIDMAINDNRNFHNDDNDPCISGGIIEPNWFYINDKTITLAVIEVRDVMGYYSPDRRIIYCDYLYIYNKERLENKAEKAGRELILEEGRPSLPYPYSHAMCLIDEQLFDSISKGDVLLVELYEENGFAVIRSYYDKNGVHGVAAAAKYENGKLALAGLNHVEQSPEHSIWIRFAIPQRLYLDEPHEPGSTYECIHDGMTVEETIAFFGHLEEDIKRFEEEYPDMIYNEVVVY